MNKNQGGFTTVEMVGIFSLLMVIILVATSVYSSAIDVAEKTTAMDDIESIANAVDTFHLSHGFLPDSLIEIGMNKKRDPWGNFYIYKKLQPLNPDNNRAPDPKNVADPVVIRELEPTYTTNANGTISIDFDGDGKVDMHAVTLTPELGEKFKAITKRIDPKDADLSSDYDLISAGEDGDTDTIPNSKRAKDDIVRRRNSRSVSRGGKY